MVTYSEKKRNELYKKAYELMMEKNKLSNDEHESETTRIRANVDCMELSMQLDNVDMADDDEADFAYGALEASIKQVESGKPYKVYA